MLINIVNYELSFQDNGILSKFANKLHEFIPNSKVSRFADENAGINHHINYLPYQPNGTKNTLMITHIFEGYKLDSVINSMKTADMGICMSQETMIFLISKGIPKEKLTFILPAHDNLPVKKKRIFICTNVYPDGCKREHIFYDLIYFLKQQQILDRFEFTIMGKGWMPMDFVSYYPEFDSSIYSDLLLSNDYMAYFGIDEGAISIVDASYVGLKTIAPETGFHIPIGIDYRYDSFGELCSIFNRLSKINIHDWTWENYTKAHVDIWKKL